jgi:hypothetical protein
MSHHHQNSFKELIEKNEQAYGPDWGITAKQAESATKRLARNSG